jgi:alkylhydroperoxidase family enzyme
VLGRSTGISDEKIRHLGDDPLPEGVFNGEEAAIVRYSQASTLMKPILDDLYDDLSQHFDSIQIMELWATVSLSNQTNRFHATFLTDVDHEILEAVGPNCPLPLPPRPGDTRYDR